MKFRTSLMFPMLWPESVSEIDIFSGDSQLRQIVKEVVEQNVRRQHRQEFQEDRCARHGEHVTEVQTGTHQVGTSLRFQTPCDLRRFPCEPQAGLEEDYFRGILGHTDGVRNRDSDVSMPEHMHHRQRSTGGGWSSWRWLDADPAVAHSRLSAAVCNIWRPWLGAVTFSGQAILLSQIIRPHLVQECKVGGIDRGAVSERFVLGTQRRLGELLRRDLSSFELVALMIDGVRVAEHVMLVGIESTGKKQIPGLS
jgi:hypothetical protein